MPKWQYGDIVDVIIVRVYISCLPKYRVNYYDYIIKLPHVCVSLDIATILALNIYVRI